jgi:Kyakuja-Dileera-Zisupton transposase
MDYVILSSLAGTKLPRVVLSYDIGCQWSKNLSQRMKDLPETLQLDPAVQVEVGIPTWHVNGHGDDCKANVSLGYMHGVGRTCGEDVETTWAQTNALGTSTREMGPGARHETLDDQWCGMNFRKTVGFRECFTFVIILYLQFTLKLRVFISQALQRGHSHECQASVDLRTILVNISRRKGAKVGGDRFRMEGG